VDERVPYLIRLESLADYNGRSEYQCIVAYAFLSHHLSEGFAELTESQYRIQLPLKTLIQRIVASYNTRRSDVLVDAFEQ
jgi:hypothetical protein